MAVSNLVYDLLKLLLWGAPKLWPSALAMLSAAHVLRGGMGMGHGGPGQLDGGLGPAGRRQPAQVEGDNLGSCGQ